MFQKVGKWLTDQSDRFIRGENTYSNGYYASSEAQQAYGGMHGEPPPEDGTEMREQEPMAEQNSMDPFERAGKDYGGRVPYQSQRDLQAQQMAYAAEQERVRREETTRQRVAQPAQQPVAGYSQQQGYGLPQQPAQPMGYSQQPQQQTRQAAQPQPSNVVPFPGMQQAPDGGYYTHMEYVVLLRSRSECKGVIEYIKTNASVFLNMEFIANDNERQRCVDMLSGAAYTLGCKLNRISGRGIYLISSPSVYVVIDPALQKFSGASETQGFARQSYEGGYTQRGVSPFEGMQAQPRAAQHAPIAFGVEAGQQTAAYQPVQAPRAAQLQPQAQPQEMAAGYRTASMPSVFAQNTQRRAPASFGSVMAGNTTGTFSPAYQSSAQPTGRFNRLDLKQ